MWYDRDGNPVETFDAEGKPILEGLQRMNSLMMDYDYRRVARTDVENYTISTVWLGIDHNFEKDGPPLIFETMVFADEADMPYAQWCWRYATEEEALRGHGAIFDALKAGREPRVETSSAT